MDCTESKSYQISKSLFKNITSYREFLNLWSKFYQNKICIPTYLDNFYGAEDNPDINSKIISKFIRITKLGVIPIDYQNGSPESQKAYVALFAPNTIASMISEYINRYPGFVAFVQQIDSNSHPTDLYVTYDGTKKVLDNSAKKGVFLGDPFTSVGNSLNDMLEFIQEWLSPHMKTIINHNRFKTVTIIDIIPTRKNNILDVIINSLSDK